MPVNFISEARVQIFDFPLTTAVEEVENQVDLPSRRLTEKDLAIPLLLGERSVSKKSEADDKIPHRVATGERLLEIGGASCKDIPMDLCTS